MCLRAEHRYQGGFRRHAVTFEKAFEKSLAELLEQSALLQALREKVDGDTAKQRGTFLTARGTYSPVVVPSLIVDGRLSEAVLQAEVAIRDACDLEQDSMDVIICDPPYGFSTTEDREALATLYSRFFDAALLAFREHGHLIVCLPSESYTGRDLPYCTYSKLVSNQILAKADRLGKHLFAPGRSIPHRMILPPYYWEAERALRRVILHYRFSSSQ